MNDEKRITRSSRKIKLTRRPVITDIDVDERENIEIEAESLKPTELFDKSDDVSGNELYKQVEGYKRKGMLAKAKAVKSALHVNSSASLEQSEYSSDKSVPRKRNDDQHFSKGLTDESESVSEDSEYEPESADGEEDDTDEMENEIDTDEMENEDETIEEDKNDNKQKKATVVQRPKSSLKKASISSCTAKKLSHDNRHYKDLHLKPEEYFVTQSEKILTSNRTLGKLKTQNLDKEKIDEILENQLHTSDTHVKAICRLTEQNKLLFPLWYFLLEEGFSILLHGLGSKRELIHDFHEEIICDHPTLIVNGFFPSLTLKDILDEILKDLMNLEAPANLNDSMDLIEETLKQHPDDRIYLLIHNIDGPMLRSNKVQDKLSYLASFRNLHLVASIDHINASLLWDNAKRSRYNFYWCNTTTFLPYREETLYENSLMVRQSGALVLSSLHNVFLSLPDKSRSVYIILVKYQIENTSAVYQGMPFKDLYQKAREGFFVTNDVTLRAQLTEFLDHKLVKVKRGIDGIEYLNIPLDNALLKQFLEQQEET